MNNYTFITNPGFTNYAHWGIQDDGDYHAASYFVPAEIEYDEDGNAVDQFDPLTTPYKLLWMNVFLVALDDMCNCARVVRQFDDEEGTIRFESASIRVWLSNDASDVGSFKFICDLFFLPYDKTLACLLEKVRRCKKWKWM